MSNTQHATGKDPIDEFLETAAPEEAHVKLCLDRVLRDEYVTVERVLAQTLARSAPAPTKVAKTAAEKRQQEAAAATWLENQAALCRDLAEKVQAVQALIDARLTDFHLRDIDWFTRGVLMGLHPPRDDDVLDRRRGFNRVTFFPALVGKCLVSVTFPDREPAGCTPEQWERLQTALEPDQMETLTNAAVALVWRPADPTSALASTILSQNSDGKSKPRGRSASATSGSPAGNPEPSPTTGTTTKAD